MMNITDSKPLTPVGEGFAFVMDRDLMARLGISPETKVQAIVTGGTLILAADRDPAREAKFTTALAEMSVRYEPTLRRLAE